MEMQIGFELEFACPLSDADIKAKFLAAAGVRLQGQARNYTQWRLHYDGSVTCPNRRVNGRRYEGREVSSAIMPYAEGIDVLEKLLKMMADDTENFVTSTSTGLHIGLSFKEKETNGKINPIILSGLLKESEIRNKFGRGRNTYCVATKPRIDKMLKEPMRWLNVGRIEWKSIKKDPEMGVKEIQAMAQNLGKFSFVNYGKLSQNYLEFRGMGGPGYQSKFDDIKAAIEHFVECMKRSLVFDKTSPKYAAVQKAYRQALLKRARREARDANKNIDYYNSEILRQIKVREETAVAMERLRALVEA